MTGSISDLASALSSHVGLPVGAHVFEVEFVQYEGPGGTGFEFLNKQLVQSPEGEASCAEVEIVRLLREAHWEAGWFQEFAPKLVTSAWRPALVERVNLPVNIQQRHDRIRARMGRQGGCWDVIAWKDDAVWYLESKGPRDGLNRNQVAWWVAAAEVDPAIGFALVEWRMRAKRS